MTNIMDNLIDYINNNLEPYTPVIVDFFQGSSEEIVCRHDPSSFKKTPYMDGSHIGVFKFEIRAKSLSAQKAVAQLNEFNEQFNLKNEFNIDPCEWVKIEPITTVRPVSITEKGEYIYATSYELEYEMEFKK